PAAAGSFGSVGAIAARALIVVFGWVGSSLLPIALAVHALRVFGRMSGGRDRSWLIFLLGMVIVLPFGVALAMGATRDDNVFSGVIGGLLAFYTTQLTGPVGAWLLFLLALSVLAAATLSWNPIRMLVGREVRPVVAGVEQAAALDDTYNPPRVRKQKLLAQQLEPEPEEMPVIDEGLSAPFELRKDRSRRRRGRERDATSAEDRVAAEIEATDVAHERFDDEDLPTPDLLTAPAPRNVDANRRDLDAAGQRLMDALRTFRVDGELVGRTTGPAVTQFEIEPAPGVKVRQISNLATDNRDAAAVLKWAVYELQSRYELLAANNARNIQDFNRKVTEKAPLKKPKTPNVAFEDLEY